MTKRFNMPEERVYKTIHKYGNTSASAVAIALDELLHHEKVQQNENLLLVAFGGGFTWGSTLLTKV
jgi:3-oxoacyl-[acyl-carrier-protein] synthase-3